MVKDPIGILNCDQSKINRQFYEMILKLQKENSGVLHGHLGTGFKAGAFYLINSFIIPANPNPQTSL